MANKREAANPAIASRFQPGIIAAGSLIRNVDMAEDLSRGKKGRSPLFDGVSRTPRVGKR